MFYLRSVKHTDVKVGKKELCAFYFEIHCNPRGYVQKNNKARAYLSEI